MEPPQEHPSRLHPRRYGDPDAQLRHALFDDRHGPACGADGPHRTSDREGPVLQHPAHRRLYVQLRLCRQPHDRQRRRQLPGRRPGLERRDACGHQEGVSRRDRSRSRGLSHAAIQPRRLRQCEEDPGSLQGRAAFGVSRRGGACGRSRNRLHQAAFAGRREEVAGVLQHPEFRPAVLPD
ncbi:hypothetical protein D9M68_470260 [compost metagenome]